MPSDEVKRLCQEPRARKYILSPTTALTRRSIALQRNGEPLPTATICSDEMGSAAMETQQSTLEKSISGAQIDVSELFEENNVAKILKTAISGLENNVRTH